VFCLWTLHALWAGPRLIYLMTTTYLKTVVYFPNRLEGRSLLLLLILFCGCSEGLAPQAFLAADDASLEVFIVHDSWHSAIVTRTTNLSAASLPEMRDFPRARYLEFSWGDRDYFQHPDPGPGLALKAAFWSSGSIIHVVGMQDSPATAYPHQAEIIVIALTPGAFKSLMDYVSQTFSRPGFASPAAAMPGLSTNARFYPAQGRFSILRTCNTWVAEALEAAGLPIASGWIITAGSLGRHVRPLGIVEPKPQPDMLRQ